MMDRTPCPRFPFAPAAGVIFWDHFHLRFPVCFCPDVLDSNCMDNSLLNIVADKGGYRIEAGAVVIGNASTMDEALRILSGQRVYWECSPAARRTLLAFKRAELERIG